MLYVKILIFHKKLTENRIFYGLSKNFLQTEGILLSGGKLPQVPLEFNAGQNQTIFFKNLKKYQNFSNMSVVFKVSLFF